MCRLAFIPAKTKISRKALRSFFSQLEGSFGGDGNGYAAISPDGRVVINKGVKFSCDQIAAETHTLIRQGYAVYFHTRKISIGWSSDEQCHPFKIDGPAFSGSLCHNGTWSDGGILAKYLQTGSDTATLAHLIGEIGLDGVEKRKLTPKSGIFLLYGGNNNVGGRHMVLNLGGSLEYCPKTGVWASEFFKDWPFYNLTYNVEQGHHMLEKPAPKRKYVVQNNYQNYGTTTYKGYVPNNYKGTEQERLNSYWKDKGYEDAIEEAEEYKLKSEDDLWAGRIFYHN